MSKFNIFTIDLRVILSIIVATGVYALLLKFLQKNSPHKCSNETRGGVKGFLNNVKKKLRFSCTEASLSQNHFGGKNGRAGLTQGSSHFLKSRKDSEYKMRGETFFFLF